MPSSLHKFYFDSIVYNRQNPEQRYGQAMFNYLYTVRPDLSEQIRGSSLDPYYCKSPTEERFDKFIQWLEENWNTNA